MSSTASASGADSEPAPAVPPDGAPGAAPANFAEATPASLEPPAPASAASTSASIEPPFPPAGASTPEPPAHVLVELDDLAVFVGPNAARFLSPLTAGQGRPRGGICWPGFVLPGPWLLYRKMYGLAALVVLLPVLLSLMRLPSALVSATGAAPMILGAFGKRLYLRNARRAIASIRAAAPDERRARAAIAEAGGVSIAGAVFGLLLIAAFVLIAVLRV